MKKILVVIVVLIVGFFIFQFVMLNRYKSEEVQINTGSIFNQTLTIENDSDSIELVPFEEMNYGNFFDGFETEAASHFNVKRDAEGEVIAYYSMFKEEQYINVLSINSFLMTTDLAKVDNSTEKNMKEFLDKNNINDDIALYKYLKGHYFIKNNIFTCYKTMRNNYILNNFIQVSLPTYDSITLLNGSVNGYIINIKRNIGLQGEFVDFNTNVGIREIHLLNNDDQYIITLYGEEIANDEFVNNLLKTISFN
jgi:hypothetical protein